MSSRYQKIGKTVRHRKVTLIRSAVPDDVERRHLTTYRGLGVFSGDTSKVLYGSDGTRLITVNIGSSLYVEL